MSAAVCAHPAGAEVLQRPELIQAFGNTAVAQIPLAPGYTKLKNDTKAAVLLSRLECGHFSMISPHTLAEKRDELEAALKEPAVKPLAKAERELKQLLADSKAGKDVSPADVVTAREAVKLAALAEEGRQERLLAEMAQAEAEARAALEGPLCQELAESREHLNDLQRDAVRAIQDLLSAVDEDMQLHDEAVRRLTEHDADPSTLRSTSGYKQTTNVGGEAFEFFMKMEWLVGTLNAIRHGRHGRSSFYGIEGRDLGKGLPPNVPGGTPVPGP
jgi:hypothetical protein